jgi:hypothetical protein
MGLRMLNSGMNLNGNTTEKSGPNGPLAPLNLKCKYV